MTATAPTRTLPLPVRLETGLDRVLLYVGDRKVASAWGPVLDDPDVWVLWNGHSDPYRVSGGRDGALALIEDRRVEWERREGSLWHPDHGPVGGNGWVAVVPAGVCCVGCGDNLDGDKGVSTVVYRHGVEVTVHYICDNCEVYLDGEEGNQ